MESESCDETQSSEIESSEMQVENSEESLEDICDVDEEYLDFLFEATRNVEIKQPICLYSIKVNDLGLAAVDIKELSDIVYATSFSSEIHVLSRNVDNSSVEESQKGKGKNIVLDSQKFIEIDLLQHSSDVTALSFTNGHLLLSGCLDGTVKAWSRNYEFVRSFSAVMKTISDIHASPRMDYFVTSSLTGLKSAGGNKTFGASMFSFSRTSPIMSFLGHTAGAQCVRIHSNGKYLATASEDSTIKMWDTQTSNCVRTFQEKNKESPHLKKIAFSPDGKYLASTYYGSVKVWDLASGRLVKTLGHAHSEIPIYNICYCKFGHKLVAGGSDGVLKIWNMKDFTVESSVTHADGELLQCHEIHKPIFNITCTNNIFSCISAE